MYFAETACFRSLLPLLALLPLTRTAGLGLMGVMFFDFLEEPRSFRFGRCARDSEFGTSSTQVLKKPLSAARLRVYWLQPTADIITHSGSRTTHRDTLGQAANISFF